GTRIHIDQVDPDTLTVLRTFDGPIVDVPSVTDEEAEATVESLDTDGLETLIPPLLIDAFPSVALSTIRDSSAAVRFPWGLMPRADLALCMPTVLALSATIASGGLSDRYIYCDDTSVPDLLVQDGDRLVYDVWQVGDTRSGYIVGNGS